MTDDFFDLLIIGYLISNQETEINDPDNFCAAIQSAVQNTTVPQSVTQKILATFLDDMAAAGSRLDRWCMPSLSSMLNCGANGGALFFNQWRTLANIDDLRLMIHALRLGFLGKYRSDKELLPHELQELQELQEFHRKWTMELSKKLQKPSLLVGVDQ